MPKSNLKVVGFVNLQIKSYQDIEFVCLFLKWDIKRILFRVWGNAKIIFAILKCISNKLEIEGILPFNLKVHCRILWFL